MSAKHLSWIGYTCIIIGAILQFIGTLQSSITLSLLGQAVSAISIPFTIWQSHRSALENQQQFDQERAERMDGDQRVWEKTEPGQHHTARQKLLHDMGKAEQQ